MVNVCLLTGTAFPRTLRSTTSGNAPGACAGRMLNTVQAGNKKSHRVFVEEKALINIVRFFQILIIQKVDQRHEDFSTRAGAVSDTLLAGQLDSRRKNVHKILGQCFELSKPQWGSVNLIPCGRLGKATNPLLDTNLTTAFFTLTSEEVVVVADAHMM